MSETKEFQGKNLDEAIEAACKHFELKRDKLEIEILSGGSSGIFGLVGVKKATVRAKPRGSFKVMQEAELRRHERPEKAERPERSERPEQSERPEKSERSERKEPRQAAQRPEGAVDRAPQHTDAEPALATARTEGAEGSSTGAPDATPGAERGDQPRRERGRRGRGGRGRGEGRTENREAQPQANAERQPERQATERPEKTDRPERGRRERQRAADSARPPRNDAQAPVPGVDEEDLNAPQGIDHLDQGQLETITREVTEKILAPLVEAPQITITIKSDRVCVHIDDPENSGLLIGREGQTLSSIQYLVNRLVSKRMDASVRVQIDTGDYRENQDEKLRQIARHLADKAISSGRTQSTRPMSSYHRRVVHMTLQNDDHVFTRSKGDGSMKRVLIVPKRRGKNDPDAPGEEYDGPDSQIQSDDETAAQ